MTDALFPIDGMKEKGQCAQCGAPLRADIAVAVCPQCELRGALNLSADENQTRTCHGTGSGEPADLAPGTDPIRVEGTGVFCQRRLGDYDLLEEIARGGMGIVYRARQASLDRVVAVKTLLAGPLATRDFVQRFRTESAAAASLQHPNIVAIHEVGFAEGQHYFAMDYVEGFTLAQLVAKGPLPARQAARYLQTVAEAIHFAHERNVLHRDLKPSNVLVDSATNQPRLTDFGLAKRLEAETELTLSGQVLGSPNYMSPEQATARRGTVGKRSDIYSLGAILYHSLTGRPPFQGESLTEVLHQVMNDDPLAPHLLAPRIPTDLETLCLKCLEKEPTRRYQTAQELADELSRFLRDEPILARPVTPVEHAWRWCRRKPAVASLTAATVLLLLSVAIGSPIAAFRINRERERADQNLYDSDMSLAQHAWDEGDLGRTLGLLEAHRPRPGEQDRRGFEWFYFRKLCEGDQRMTLPGHSQPVKAVAFSPDGKRLATGSVGDPVRIWDCATGTLVKTLPEQNVVSLAFSPDGQTLGVGGRDHVVVWDLETGRAVFKLEEVLGRFRIAFSPVGTLLMIGKHGGSSHEDGGIAELWDYGTGELKRVFPESGGHIALSPRGDLLATGNWSHTIKIWDLASGQFVRSLKTGLVTAMALSPDGRTLATCYWGPAVQLWDVNTGEQIGSLTNNQHRVWGLAFSPDGLTLATGDADQKVRLWDVATRQQTEKLQGHGGEVLSVAFSADGLSLASGSRDKKAMLWSVKPNRAMTMMTNVISRPVFSRDGRLVAAGIGQNKVAAWDVATLKVRAVFEDARDALAFSSDGSALITEGANYFLRTFDVAKQTARETIQGRPAGDTESRVALSPDGHILVAGSTNGTLTFFDAKTGAVIPPIAHAYACRIFRISFSPKGKFLATTLPPATTAFSYMPAIWDMATHKMVAAPAGHTEVVLWVAFSPEGETLATCGADDSILFWNTTTWRQIAPSLGHKEYITGLAYAPNGRTLATASYDGTMKLWNVGTRRELASLKLGAKGMEIEFSPDGQALAAWGWADGSLRLWRAPVPDRTQHP